MKYKTKAASDSGSGGSVTEDTTGDNWLLTDLGYYAYNLSTAAL